MIYCAWEWRYSSTHSKHQHQKKVAYNLLGMGVGIQTHLSHYLKVNDQLRTVDVSPMEKHPLYSLDRWMGGIFAPTVNQKPILWLASL